MLLKRLSQISTCNYLSNCYAYKNAPCKSEKFTESKSIKEKCFRRFIDVVICINDVRSIEMMSIEILGP